MINIVTSLCIDLNKNDESVYLQLSYRNSQQRRIAYWKCVTVFFCSSLRCNPSVSHTLYTNDEQPLEIDGIDPKAFLQKMGVSIVYLPFQHFVPPQGYSEKYRNAFYKFDVIKHLGSCAGDTRFHMLMDADCVWVNPGIAFLQSIRPEQLLLYNAFENEESLTDKKYGFTRFGRDSLGRAFKQLDPSYPATHPVLFGGEIIGGNGHSLSALVHELEKVFLQITQLPIAKVPRITWESCRNDGIDEGLLDGDENVSSFVLNKPGFIYVNAKGYLRRIKTHIDDNRATLQDLELTVWHLPDEKKQGFVPLFKQAVNKQSLFWQTPLKQFAIFLGNYLGIPKRNSQLEVYKYKMERSWLAMLFITIKSMKRLNHLNKAS